MKRIISIGLIICIVMQIMLFTSLSPKYLLAQEKGNFWEIQSIDTMKYSRDLARERNGDKVFERIIETYTEKIASAGATHVAVGTPYDEEFIPFLEQWVSAARRVNLNVWFRSNFSGWEGWFGYPIISKEEHINNIEDFILENPDLFEDGDIFTPCTECENGLLGDPRETKDVESYREFLIEEYKVSNEAFRQIRKNVDSGYFSMNLDVARLVMDRETTRLLGGVVVIDHYVKDPVQLSQDVRMISEETGGKVILGEFGIPIPDIHGNLTDDEQANWISEVLSQLSKESVLYGLNYWVSFGGTTAIWNNNGSEKPAVSVIRSYFTTDIISGLVLNEIGQPVENALVIADSKQTYSGEKGEFNIVSNPTLSRIVVNAKNYKDEVVILDKDNPKRIIIEKEKEGVIFKFRKFFYNTYKKIKER